MFIEDRDAAKSTRDITFPHPREKANTEEPYQHHNENIQAVLVRSISRDNRGVHFTFCVVVAGARTPLLRFSVSLSHREASRKSLGPHVFGRKRPQRSHPLLLDVCIRFRELSLLRILFLSQSVTSLCF